MGYERLHNRREFKRYIHTGVESLGSSFHYLLTVTSFGDPELPARKTMDGGVVACSQGRRPLPRTWACCGPCRGGERSRERTPRGVLSFCAEALPRPPVLSVSRRTCKVDPLGKSPGAPACVLSRRSSRG